MQLLTFIVDLTISINVCFSDHLIHFLISQLLSKVCHHMAQLSSTDVPIAILRRGGKKKSQHFMETALKALECADIIYLVKDTECFSDLLLAICVLHLPGHHGKKFGEVYRSIP